MLTGTALKFVNHVLIGTTWARTRLKPFAGLSARFSFGPFAVPVTVSDVGLFTASEQNTTAAVCIQLPANAPLRALTDRPSLFAAAQISGSAEFAEALGFVFRNLRWEAEDDLSRLVGDVAAHRLLQGGRRFGQWQLQRAKNLALNVAEYLTEEIPVIARHTDIEHFCSAVDVVRNDCTRLEKRLQKLESR